jgi:hypothetical protein
MALLRQAQEYFHMHLLGVVKWDDVVVDKPIPIPAIKGQRDQGKVKDLVVAQFNGFRMELMGPFESEAWPLGRVKVSRGDSEAEGPLDATTWVRIADFIKQQKQGVDDGRSIPGGESWGR